MYSKSEIEDRNLAITTYELNFEILRSFLINFYKMKINSKNISFKRCIEELNAYKVITKQEFEEIQNFILKKQYFCRFIDKNNDILKIEEIEQLANYLQSFLNNLIEHINTKYNLTNTYLDLLEEE